MKRQGRVVAICIGPAARAAMQEVEEVMAIAGAGLQGDRYSTGDGSYNRKKGVGHRQVTLMNARFFPDSGFMFREARRNLFTEGVELMDLVGKEFDIGEARFCGERYCDPCLVPTNLAGKDVNFREAFHDRGGLIAVILSGGLIRLGSHIVGPPKDY